MVTTLKEKPRQKLQRIVREIRAREFPYEPREEKKIDWFAYNRAQVNEINDYLELVRALVDEAGARLGVRPARVGRPPKSAYDKAKAVLVQQFFECSNRVTEGLMKLFREKLGLTERLLTYKDVERAYGDPEVLLVLKLVFELSNSPVGSLETKFALDGSGMPRSVKSNYDNDKHGGGGGRNKGALSVYDKFVGVVGCEYKLYSAVAVTNGEANECPFLIPLMEQTRQLYDRIEAAMADAAYLSRENCTYLEGIGATPYILPKSNSVFNARGSKAWKHMMTDLIDDTQGWLRQYHLRSIAETGNSMIKCRFTRPLLKRLDNRRFVESFSKLCRHNLRRLIYIYYVNGVEVKWLGEAS